VSDHRGEMLALTTLAEMSRSMGEISEAIFGGDGGIIFRHV